MWICESCGLEYPPEKKFCRKCGGKLVERAPAPAAPAAACPQCGEPTTPGKKFCRVCGFLLQVAEPEPQEACPSCGAAVPRGKRFCGACGAALGPTVQFAPASPEISPADAAAPAYGASPAAAASPAWAAERSEVVEEPSAPEPVSTPTVVARSPFAAMIESPLPPPEAKIAEAPVLEPPVTVVAPPIPEPAEPYATEMPKVAPTIVPERPAPYSAPPRAQEAEAAPRSRLLLIVGAVVIVLALAGAGVWYFFLSTEARILSAIEKGRLVAPQGDSAYSLYLEAKAANQLSVSLQQKVRARALDKLSNAGEALLKKRLEAPGYSPQELEELRRTYEWAFELAPDDAQIAARKDYVMGLLALVNEKPREALDPLRASLDKNAGWAPGWHDLGRAYARTNNAPRAVDSFERAISLAPDWAEPYVEAGVIYAQQSNWPSAESRLQRAAELDASLATPWYFLGQTYEGTRDCARAIAAYEKAAELSAKRPSTAFRVETAQSRLIELRAQCASQPAVVAELQKPVRPDEKLTAAGAQPQPPPSKPAPARRMELGTVATCSAFRGFGDFTARPQVRPGESFCVYAEVLNANRGGEVDLVFSYAILSPANEAVLRRSSQLAHRTGEVSVAWAADFRMPADAQPGIYTVTVTVRSELSGETQSKSAYFTVMPRM
jgi:tetratricopeptide (TPR) repeat protein